ncbi:MAG: hypothetical protein H7245_21410 [Candidatus Saccharibacteria bacterium]|nr:hypothetical protein [Pseudorhodobacter sp.]
MPILDFVLNRFYQAVAADWDMSGYFSDQAILNHARNPQKKHWELLLAGNFCEDYRASAGRIGRVHFKIQLPFHMYLAGYACATTLIQKVVLEKAPTVSFKSARHRMAEQLGALTRAFAVDVNLMVESHFSAQREEQ